MGYQACAATLAAAMSTMPAWAADIAERPDWKIGDKWQYHATSDHPAKESDWSWEIRLTMIDGTYNVETESGRVVRIDAEGNSLDSRGRQYSWRRLNFPLQVGKRWDHEYKMEGPNSQGYIKSSWEVKAHETITVPAGTFECLRVEGMAWRDWTPIYRPGGITSSKDSTATTYWYCPTVRQVAKWHTIFINPWTSDFTTISELTSFTLTP